MNLLSRSELPPWLASDSNPFILSGYRSESRSWARSLASWAYRHNETGNIYSHLLPGVALTLTVLILELDLRSGDGFVVAVQLAAAVLCLLVSALYHTALNHSEAVARFWLQVDYGGILGLILGNFLSGLHFGFYCHPGLKNLYWSMIVAASCATGVVLLSPWFRAPQYRSLRLVSCVATGMSAFAPIGHAWYLWGHAYLLRIGVPYYLLEGVFLLAGCYVFESRVPESLYPGRFDIWGHSHTWWHILVVLSIVSHIAGLWSAWDYNHRHALCRVG